MSFDYNVTPHLVGNLADLTFDGQTAITQRGLRGPSCHYIGNRRWIQGEDRPDLRDEAGGKTEFLGDRAVGARATARATRCARWGTGSRPARATRWRTTTSRPP